MVDPDRSVEDAALIAFVRRMNSYFPGDDDTRLFTALLSRLEGRGSGTEQADKALARARQLLAENLAADNAAIAAVEDEAAWEAAESRRKASERAWVNEAPSLLYALASSPSSVATGAAADVTQGPIWKLTARIDEALREIMDRTDSVNVTGIAAASTWLTAEIRGHLARKP
jgi:hypothetical protein